MSSTNKSNNCQVETIPENKINEEAKLEGKILKPKYPAGLQPTGGLSIFLQKRLQKGKKYFDSADYQMAKQNYDNILQPCDSRMIISTSVPTPETVRKMTFPQSSNKCQIDK